MSQIITTCGVGMIPQSPGKGIMRRLLPLVNRLFILCTNSTRQDALWMHPGSSPQHPT